MKKELFHLFTEIIVVSLFLGVSTTAWATSNKNNNQQKSLYNKLQEERLDIKELSSGIKLENAYPQTNEEGMSSNESYKFKVLTHTNKTKDIKISFINDEHKIKEDHCKALPYKNIKYVMYKDNKLIEGPKSISNDGTLLEDKIQKEATYELKLWIAYESGNEIMGTHFHGKITLN